MNSLEQYKQFSRIAAFAGWRHSDPKFEIYSEYVKVNSRQELLELGSGVVVALGEVKSVVAAAFFETNESLVSLGVLEFLETCEALKKAGGIVVMGLFRDDFNDASAVGNLRELLSAKYKVHTPPRMPVVLIDSELRRYL